MAEKRLEEIRRWRLQKRQELIDSGQVPYPAEARRTHSLAALRRDFSTINKDQTPVTVVGRMIAIRRHGALNFLTLRDSTGEFQLQIAKDQCPPDIFARLTSLDIGDWIEAAGGATRSKRGEPTVLVKEFHLLSKSIRPLPEEWYGLKDHETRYRQRDVDLWLNEKVRDIFTTRSKLINWLRQYFIDQGYLEVETPMLQAIPGGTLARPFITHHNALDISLYLRIAAELYLKRLLVGGYEKVFEMGRYLRNEGIDRQHNPEFTMLESQWAFADYEDLMDFTEDIFEKIITEFAGSAALNYQGKTLDFEKPFKRIRYVDVVSQKLGLDILAEEDPAAYVAIFKQKGLAVPAGPTYTKLVDELYKELIRPTLTAPTLLYDYPAAMAPLAKPNATDPRYAEKFQLVVNGFELVNAYTELNDPVLQRAILEKQLSSHQAGDEEAHQIDESYLTAMEYGMPPNAGWGLGIDRLVMLLTDSANIRDTILFPLLRPEP